jgi:hypothetical protein
MCASCRWLGAGGEACPLDGPALQVRENILEDAVHAAAGQSAAVLALRDRASSASLGGIAASLRF